MSTQNENVDLQQETNQSPGIISHIFRYVIMFFILSYVMKMFNKNQPNYEKNSFKNILSENEEFYVNFYVSPNYIKDFSKIEPILVSDKISLSNTTRLYNLSIQYHNTNDLFLYANIKFSPSTLEKINKKFDHSERNINMNYENIITYKFNMIKKKENLTETIKQQRQLNDDHYSPDIIVNNTEFIPNRYYVPEACLYINYPGETLDMSSLEEMRILGIEYAANYREKVFFPNFYITDFWTMLSEFKPLKKEDTLNVSIHIGSMDYFYFKLMRGIEVNSEMMEKNFNLPSSKDLLVELLKSNSTSYLILLFTVNILHTIFSTLSFTSDISYHKNLKKLDGVYTKNLFFNIFYKLIAAIYVYIENSHMIVKVELFVGLCIELWKMKKIFNLSFKKNFPFIDLKHKLGYQMEKSKDYESEAINLTMKFIFLPVAVCYVCYRLYYYKERIMSGIFVFLIETIFFMLNLFGFILMTPQVYLNYKLKSVEHMPFKVLTFNFLNTIIDDLFVFAIKTPLMYRISCFKDDVIFVIFIYQLIAYRKNKRMTDEEDIKKEEISETKSLDEKKNN